MNEMRFTGRVDARNPFLPALVGLIQGFEVDLQAQCKRRPLPIHIWEMEQLHHTIATFHFKSHHSERVFETFTFQVYFEGNFDIHMDGEEVTGRKIVTAAINCINRTQ
jgi:hypothetical protein